MTETKNEVRTRKLVAADLLNEEHPLHKSFVEFCGDNPLTKRQGKKFLQKYPAYRDVDVEIETK
jgi:hypothetical protein